MYFRYNESNFFEFQITKNVNRNAKLVNMSLFIRTNAYKSKCPKHFSMFGAFY